MFYDIYTELCQKTGEKPYAVAALAGVKNNSSVASWQRGSVPRQPVLEKIAAHFGVSIDYLLTGKEKQPPVAEGLSEIALAIARIVDSLPEENRRLLLAQVQAVKQATEGRDGPSK